MTTNEAKQKVDACEQQIVSAFYELKDSAREVGSSATSSASKRTTMSLLLPLILCVIGFFCFRGPWFLGILLFIGGIVLAHKLHTSAKDIQRIVETGQKNLNSAIDNNA